MIETGLAGKAVLVTGAHHGIGAAIADAFAAQGARTAIHYFTGGDQPPHGISYEHTVADDPALAQQTLRHLKERGAPDALAVPADLGGSRPEQADAAARQLFDAVEARFGSIDVLVNNAAHCEHPDSARSVTADGLHRTYRVNVYAPALLAGELVRRKRPADPACVINISTDAARAFPGQIAYGTSKAALEAYTRAAAIELGPLGVRVNAIAPGPVQTGWISQELIEEVRPTIPLRRVGEPQDIADAAVFLASAQARWITGQVLQVAGGHAL